jgi:hypothetical protein
MLYIEYGLELLKKELYGGLAMEQVSEPGEMHGYLVILTTTLTQSKGDVVADG